MVAWLKKLFGFSVEKTRDSISADFQKKGIPWASFEVVGFEDDGRVKVHFTWNEAFISKIKGIGFDAETDEDRVQLFFFTSSMRPTALAANDDQAVQSDAHPQLSSINNELRT